MRLKNDKSKILTFNLATLQLSKSAFLFRDVGQETTRRLRENIAKTYVPERTAGPTALDEAEAGGFPG